MKIRSFLVITFLLAAFAGISQKTSPLVGTWKQISGSMTYAGTTTTDDMTKTEAMKIVTPTHFAVFSKDITTGDIGHAGAGTIKVDGNTYSEIIMYATGTGNKYPMIAKFTYELKGDKWHIKGGYDDLVFDEVWQKMK